MAVLASRTRKAGSAQTRPLAAIFRSRTPSGRRSGAEYKEGKDNHRGTLLFNFPEDPNIRNKLYIFVAKNACIGAESLFSELILWEDVLQAAIFVTASKVCRDSRIGFLKYISANRANVRPRNSTITI